MDQTVIETTQHDRAVGNSQPARQFYLKALEALDDAGVQYLVGGGYALTEHTGIIRDTKDLDVFVRPGECRRTVDVLASAGYRTEWTWPHFLAKALYGPYFVDILFNSGNGLSPVDDEWFAYAPEGELLGRRALFIPVEEMIWSKAFVMERDRFDGADVAHLILRCGSKIDWKRLIRHFQNHERVLLAQLILYGYIYPAKQEHVPAWVIDELTEKLRHEPKTAEPICRGTFLAQHQYQIDVHKWGFIDARLAPRGPLRADDIARFVPPDAPVIR
jgi:hypothetical protein